MNIESFLKELQQAAQAGNIEKIKSLVKKNDIIQVLNNAAYKNSFLSVPYRHVR